MPPERRRLPVEGAPDGVHPDVVGLWVDPTDDLSVQRYLLYDGCCVTLAVWFVSSNLPQIEHADRARYVAHRSWAAWDGDLLTSDSTMLSDVVARREVGPDGVARLARWRQRGSEWGFQPMMRVERLSNEPALDWCMLAAREPYPPSGERALACDACPP